MAQPIMPEVWQQGIEDNDMLPGRVVTKYFKGSNPGIRSIANCAEACRVWDIVTTDYITDYDDRRLNGLANYAATTNPAFNHDGRDGWGASSYGVFQDVRMTSRLYNMSRHRSMAMRVFDEMQFSGDIGTWGTATTSNVITSGQNLMKTAEQLSRARTRWEQEVLGPDIDKYSLFAVINGHMSGRLVGTSPAYNDQVFDGNASHYQWIATPGMVQGAAIEPQFAPVHCIEWDDQNIPLLLQTIKVTWNNLYLPQDNRIILMDGFYEYPLLAALTGKGVPATEAAYADIQNGSFTKLMGWTFAFDIPSAYWPSIYVDDNLNVVHAGTKAAALAMDKRINSIAGDSGKDWKLLQELVAATRMGEINWIRTEWNNSSGKFEKRLTNYPLGFPGFNPWTLANGTTTPATIGDKAVVSIYPDAAFTAGAYSQGAVGGLYTSYPWTGPGSGYGLKPYGATKETGEANVATGPVIAGAAPTLVKVAGLALYMNAAQVSQEYSGMVTDEGRTRGKFTEMCYDVKYDAWVIEKYSAGILPIIDNAANTGTFSIPVSVISQPAQTIAAGQTVTVSPAADAVFKTQEQTPSN